MKKVKRKQTRISPYAETIDCIYWLEVSTWELLLSLDFHFKIFFICFCYSMFIFVRSRSRIRSQMLRWSFSSANWSSRKTICIVIKLREKRINQNWIAQSENLAWPKEMHMKMHKRIHKICTWLKCIKNEPNVFITSIACITTVCPFFCNFSLSVSFIYLQINRVSDFILSNSIVTNCISGNIAETSLSTFVIFFYSHYIRIHFEKWKKIWYIKCS